MNIGVVGATGLVGQEILKVLEERSFPVESLYLWASERSAGSTVEFQEKELQVEALQKGCFKGKQLDYVFFSGGGDVSAQFCEEAADSGAIVIDNSSHFRMDEDVPLIVPEVNPDDILQCQDRGIIANPNCSTIQMVVALKPLHDAVALKRVVVSTYQSVSGAGLEAMDELQNQVTSIFSGKEFEAKKFTRQIAFNCIPHIDVFYENGMTKEEMKMILETRKILHHPQLAITATAVRVPVFISHAESLNIEFSGDISTEEIRELLFNAPGVVVCDKPDSLDYPTPVEATNQDSVLVGRIRKDESAKNAFHLWVVADNLRKGAATNAVQIAELCMERQFSRSAA